LQELWVVTSEWVIAKGKNWKIRQIHKFIETLDWVINKTSLKDSENISVADMWSGKWYLTFAVYDYLKNSLKKSPKVVWIECRKELVDICNSLVQTCQFDDLSFCEWAIHNYALPKNDILIALHACDTATDDAIFAWIQSESEIIILSPCCHKQIRKSLPTEWSFEDILRHGILKERQAEILTDTLRALVLELNGYKTQIFEYIADAHTHKNVMIVWIKKPQKNDTKMFQTKISELKQLYGITDFYLEKLFTRS
jgi:hypothetical protein